MWKTTLAIVFGSAMTFGMVSLTTNSQAAPPVAIQGGWRYTDGYWNYYDQADRAWYHTDGQHWYTHANGGWNLYNFDRNFGRKEFVRDGYVAPRAEVKVAVPRHGIYIP